MSADNYNLVKRLGDRWRAMTGLSASCDEDVQVKRGQWLGDFATRDAAIEWAEAQGYTEYGTRVYDNIEPTLPSLSHLRELLAKGTPGPYEVGEYEDEAECAATLRAQPRNATTGEPDGSPVDVIIPFGRAYSDARLTAGALNALPILLEIAEAAVRLRGEDSDEAWRALLAALDKVKP